ncbi:hypothetical protein SPRG_14639 [Saprolegnia parasitica CBS 223.65]|uniref:FYVE-type domain-containing protein n=1 Tax=Saprolegnia parasitica (strain CBS 223.65) TaxID=695850 RepID=A0A067BTF1_SAPPC|nr:hypothetical protein SPRG_14639 [Saprolegnia parasitica CBS 223.65]KDO20100.1 hypothetical protein SPRG_14639 [Saprolegnia parasitica CBS 223.65]|eukprot:XP_012209203.1 hypothetical protein SPRG_14639 [Saprolegnia parasitica CBS 223.65]
MAKKTDETKLIAGLLDRIVGKARECDVCGYSFGFAQKRHKCDECDLAACAKCYALTKAKLKCGYRARDDECTLCLHPLPPSRHAIVWEIPPAQRGLSLSAAQELCPDAPIKRAPVSPVACKRCASGGEAPALDATNARVATLEGQLATAKRQLETLQRETPARPVSDLEKENRRLKRQLEQAGMQVADNMSYADAKASMTSISRRMAEIGSSDVQHQDKAVQAALQGEYFTLEQEMEKCYVAMMASEEYEAEIREAEIAWHTKYLATHEAALRSVRQGIPVHVANLSKDALVAHLQAQTSRPDAPVVARRLKTLKVLHLLRVEPQKILVVHPCELVKLPFNKLCLLERQALYAALFDIAAEWQKQDKNKNFGDKFKWFKSLRDGLMRDVAAIEAHIGPDHTCELKARCPGHLEQKAADVYATSWGFPSGAIFPSAADVVPVEAPAVVVAKPALPTARKAPAKPQRPTPMGGGVPMSLLAALQARKKD